MPLIAGVYHNSPDEMPFDFTEIVAAIAPRGFFTSSPLHDDNFDVGGVREGLAVASPVYCAARGAGEVGGDSSGLSA